MTPPTQLHWGLLSTAAINGALLKAMPAAPRGTVLAVASRTLATAQAYAQAHHLPRAYGSYAELLADPDIHIIYNALPNHLHAEWTIKALEAGKHVLCEKPFALTLADVDAMFVAARTHGRVLADAFMYRHHPKILKLKELVDSGAIGEPRLLRASFSFTLKRPGNTRWEPGMGGGALWDVGCYPVSLARYLFGAPERVSAWQHLGPTGIDLDLAGLLQFSNGRAALIDCSFAQPYRSQAEVVGTHGTLTLTRPFQPDAPEAHLWLRRDNADEEIVVANPERYWLEIEDMHDAILTGQPPRLTPAETRGYVETILDLYANARSFAPP